MNMFKPTEAKTPDEYIAMVGDESRRKDIQELHELIKKTVPDLKPLILYGMIGYGTFHYKYASGREGDWTVLGLANQKNYISFYACMSDGQQYIAEKYKKKLPKASIGKSCIRFKKLADVDLGVIKEIIKENEEIYKAQNKSS